MVALRMHDLFVNFSSRPARSAAWRRAACGDGRGGRRAGPSAGRRRRSAAHSTHRGSRPRRTEYATGPRGSAGIGSSSTSAAPRRLPGGAAAPANAVELAPSRVAFVCGSRFSFFIRKKRGGGFLPRPPPRRGHPTWDFQYHIDRIMRRPVAVQGGARTSTDGCRRAARKASHEKSSRWGEVSGISSAPRMIFLRVLGRYFSVVERFE